MRIQRSKLSSLVNFLLGASWALVFISIIFTFLSYFPFSIIDAILMGFFAALPGLFLVVLLEYIMAGQEKLDEVKKQTLLLEELVIQGRKVQEDNQPKRQ